MNRTSLYSSLFLSLLAGTTIAGEIVVDATKIEQENLTSWHYGMCMEDVNHEVYGGLYDQRLYGESFEEPIRPPRFEGWATYGGDWGAPEPNRLTVRPSDGGKIVLAEPEFADGTLEFDIRFEGGRPESNAGALMGVRDAREGADAFAGYEIGLTEDGDRIILGKHEQNWTPLQEATVSVNTKEWQRVRVKIEGPRIQVFLNGGADPLIDFSDPNPLPAGSVGFRTWGAEASFRNVSVATGGKVDRKLFVRTAPNGVSGMWDAVQTDTARADFLTDIVNPFNGRQSQRIRHLGGAGSVGVANQGLNRWGVATRTGEKYEGSIYLRADAPLRNVSVALQNADGSKTYAASTLAGGVTGDWKKFDFTLTPSATDPEARFVVTLDEPGTLSVDQAVLMGDPAKRFHGQPVRNDIAEIMKDGGVKFLRYGGTAVNAPEYRWVNMIGDRDKRPTFRGHWYPHTSNGFGIEEFVAFSKASGYEPAFAINVEETPEDMANMIEYLNGPATSTWGKVRAANGHPEPYGVKFIEIGNEEVIWGDNPADYDHYIERFNLLHDAMRKVDPSLVFINAAWWRGNNPSCEKVLKALDGKAAYWDFHTWADAADSGREVDKMLTEARELFEKWKPGAKMKVVIFEENGNRHDLERALGHATTLNAVRKHADFVEIDCAANALQPWQQNDNGWDQGQVFFTTDQAWGMPPYYTKKMAAENHLPLLVRSKVWEDRDLDVTATRSEDGKVLCLHVVNLSGEPSSTKVKLNGFAAVKDATVWTLSGGLRDRNTPSEPEKIVPVKSAIADAGENFAYQFPPHSYTVLRLER